MENPKKRAPVIAVIGSDGAGKSTVVTTLVQQFSERTETQFIYFGTGDGPGSLLRKPLVWLKNNSKFRESDEAPAIINDASTPSSKKSVPDLAKAIWAISVAFERRGKMKQARQCADNGVLVITDRYPQAEYHGIHDGARLGEWLESGRRGPLLWLAKWELKVYRELASQKPDLVLLLDVSLDVAAGRRPGEPRDELERRIKVARSLNFMDAERAVIDADQPKEVVLEQATSQVMKKVA